MSKGQKSKPIGKNILTRFLRTVEDQGLEFLGKYYSAYRAIVHSREDPEDLDRLQLVIPSITGDVPYEEWFFPRGNYSGKGYGHHNLPEVGDIVLVTFDMGSPDYPGFWEHGHWAIGEKPTDKELGKDGIWWVSKGKNIISLNDTENTIFIKHVDGNTLMLEKDYISLVAKDKKISLGSPQASKEAAVLGDTNKDLLLDIISALDDIYLSITTAQVVTDQSGAGLLASMSANLSAKGFPKYTSLANKASQTLSKKVTLD